MMARAGEWEEVALRRMGGSRGLREDLSEITRTLARQLRGVAAFLAPPPPIRPPPPPPPPSSSSAAALPPAAGAPSAPSSSPRSPSSRALVGVRSDLAEIGGGFKTGFAALSCLLRNSADNGGGRKVGVGSRVSGVVGVTDEVLKFVEFLSGRPEEWVQCPVPLDCHFEMSDVRREHIASVERLVPSLAALKRRLCPSQISVSTFWKIYLFLLHPKLSQHDSELLSTLQIVEEMDRALQDLRNRIIKRLESSRADASPVTNETRGEIEEVETQVPGEVSPNSERTLSWVNAIEKENVEQWLEDVELLTSFDAWKQLGSEEEVFLSDPENDDHHLGLRRHTSSSSLEVVHISSPGSSNEWIPLRRNRSGLPPRSGRKPVRPHPHEQKMDGESSDWVDAGDSDSTLG